METRSSSATCPVCKSAIDKDRLIPLYGRGTAKQEDPRFGKKKVQAKSLLPAFTRDNVPPRPPGQREEPVAQPAGGDVSCWHSFRNREMFPFLSVTSRVTE